ncbi:hypothetical protein DQ04_01471070 [Trypanosoma grayi]|uniref:hypothetical protein n=1 Tax=Trypanosoma grayi TaxID=71804 RepID=UPI0004F40E0B|nr:hypothetical protein DQ04_01471070 [Trypanosoma grayi]KEG12721.1 hypothetical protein DQ04_01471070 [Trypanosoma grayi]
MGRHLSRAVVAQVIDALNVQRKTALLSLPFEASWVTATTTESSSGGSASSLSRLLNGPLDTEREVLPFVRDAVLRAVERTPRGRDSKLMPEEHEVGALMEGRRLVGLNLTCSRLSADLNRSDLTGADFTDAFASHSTFNLARMQRCSLAGAQLHSCTFLATDAVGVDARRCRFSHCVFCRTDMTDWDVRGATFYRCAFTMSDMSGWLYDGATMVVEPVDWSRCRRLNWRAAAGCSVRECNVVRKNTSCSSSSSSSCLSLGPRDCSPSRG